MKPVFTIALALIAAACAPLPNTSQSILARSLLTDTTVGGPDFPVVVTGAEAVGLTPVTIAQNLRFPARMSAESSFRAVEYGPGLVNHAHLAIGAGGTSTITFLHGDRRIGVGTFTLPPAAYADPHALGSTSAVLIDSMLRDARNRNRNDKWDY